jgi:hypothetical protein
MVSDSNTASSARATAAPRTSIAAASIELDLMSVFLVMTGKAPVAVLC